MTVEIYIYIEGVHTSKVVFCSLGSPFDPMPKKELKCIASGCTPDFCSEHKVGDFKCATPGCNNLVHGRAVHDASAFLDEGYENRKIAGVILDATLYQRPSCATTETVITGSDGQLKTVLRNLPRVGEANHAYLCQACSLKIVGKPEKSNSVRLYRMRCRLRYDIAKHVIVPVEKRSCHVNGQFVEIRVLGPGLSDHDVDKLKVLRTLIHPNLATNMGTTQLPVKVFTEDQLYDTGVEKGKDTEKYRVVLGVLIDGTLRGQCELVLPVDQVESQNKTLLMSMYIENLFLEENFRSQGIGSFVMSYILYFTRFLKTEFGTNLEYLRMHSSPQDQAANAIALKNGFFRVGDPSDDYNWFYLLRTSHEEAIAHNQKTRFLQYLKLPIVVKHKRNVLFGFIYNYQNRLHAATHTLQIPSATHYVNDDESIAMYKISDYLMSQNKFPFRDDWMQEQATFFLSLSHEEHITILTYSYRGDQMVNRYMQFGTVHNAASVNMKDRTSDWYCNTFDAFQYLLFQTQLSKVYGESFTVRCVDDVYRIAKILRTWHTNMWTPVMEQYISDLRDLYARAPALKFPMISYRGEQSGHIYGDLSKTESNTEKRIISSSLDPSVAAFFTYVLKSYDKYNIGPGSIYTITWPVGTKLILTLGSNPTYDVMESEVRALHPRFRVCGSGLDGADHSGIITQNIKIEFMRPIRSKRDVVGLDETTYCIKHLEAY